MGDEAVSDGADMTAVSAGVKLAETEPLIESVTGEFAEPRDGVSFPTTPAEAAVESPRSKATARRGERLMPLV